MMLASGDSRTGRGAEMGVPCTGFSVPAWAGVADGSGAAPGAPVWLLRYRANATRPIRTTAPATTTRLATRGCAGGRPAPSVPLCSPPRGSSTPRPRRPSPGPLRPRRSSETARRGPAARSPARWAARGEARGGSRSAPDPCRAGEGPRAAPPLDGTPVTTYDADGKEGRMIETFKADLAQAMRRQD